MVDLRERGWEPTQLQESISGIDTCESIRNTGDGTLYSFVNGTGIWVDEAEKLYEVGYIIMDGLVDDKSLDDEIQETDIYAAAYHLSSLGGDV